MARSACLADLAEPPGPSNLDFNLASFEEKAGLAVTKQEGLINNGNRRAGRAVRAVFITTGQRFQASKPLKAVFSSFSFFFCTSDQQHVCAIVKVNRASEPFSGLFFPRLRESRVSTHCPHHFLE